MGYYKPYLKIFWADMFFATLSAVVALTIPLVVRYVTSTLIYLPADEIIRRIIYIGIGLVVLLAIDCYSRFFIGNYGHVMGARWSMTCVRSCSDICRSCRFRSMMMQKSDS